MTTVLWNPNLYLKNMAPRLRPALDLLRSAIIAIPPGKEASDVKRVLDLGCGPGTMTYIDLYIDPYIHMLTHIRIHTLIHILRRILIHEHTYT